MSFWRKLRTAATSTLDTGAPLIGTVNARSFRFEDVCTTPAPNLASLARFACNLREIGTIGCAPSGCHDLDRIGVLVREITLHRQVALLGGQAVGEGGDTALADVQAKDRCCR